MSVLETLVEQDSRTVIQLRCDEGDPRAELVVLCEDVSCAQIECTLDHALAMLDAAREMFRLRGHGLRVEIVARACVTAPRTAD